MKLELRYPQSFLKLLSIGFALVTLPLIVGLVGNAISIRQLSAKSQQAVYQASQVIQGSRALLENINDQERAARQYRVLGDPALRDNYRTLHRRFVDLVERQFQLPLQEAQKSELGDIARSEGALYAALGDQLPSRRGDDPAPHFAALTQLAQTMLKHNDAAIDREIEDLQLLAADAERTMVGQLLALLPAAAFLVIGFTHLLSRPIAQIEAAIGGLWAGRFERRIEVGGPRDLQSLGEQLDRLRLRLVQLEEEKSRFLRHISHELKTPLTALREGADLLGEEVTGPLTPGQREIVAILVENSQRLRQLIEDLLNYSAAEFEQSALRRQRFPLRELIQTVIETQRLAWSARELQIDVDVPEMILNADRERIRTVLDNLLSNAIKFSPPQSCIRIVAHRDGNEAVVEVADQGPGIAAEDRDRVFDPFYQGRTPSSGALKGSGLGLSIAREHVLSHGGRIVLPPGPGGRFEVRLPLQ
ncbi:MAG: HAMP domain-containing histidine kinase [Rhodocyclaceae bacterium]|jgi:two-component system sensor histidine kinase GlrK|nr:HAMP domain-containing histidine kinase [Rhodocyclaceae bacterium]